MPLAPMKPCSKVGCNKLTRKRYCEKHAKLVQQRYEKDRGSAAQRGYDSRWRKARIGFLSMHPLCVYCFAKGLIVEATVVDHITPHKGDKALFWDWTNWQSLCKKCHDIKTVTEDGGFRNTRSIIR